MQGAAWKLKFERKIQKKTLNFVKQPLQFRFKSAT
jgi:hypothetical protein